MTESDKLTIETYFTTLDVWIELKVNLKKDALLILIHLTNINVWLIYILILLSPEEITQKANKLQELYNDDLEKSFVCE